MAKQSRTIQEQIDLLKSRNMLFEDEVEATKCLANVSYYRLKGYWWEMQDDKVNHHFINGSYFENVIELYNFDIRFRLIVFHAIERIEIALRTKMIYQLSSAYGPEWYLDFSLFSNNKHFSDFQINIHTGLKKSSEVFLLEHYRNHPKECPECWKALEILTLGSLSKLYQNLDHQLPEKN